MSGGRNKRKAEDGDAEEGDDEDGEAAEGGEVEDGDPFRGPVFRVVRTPDLSNIFLELCHMMLEFIRECTGEHLSATFVSFARCHKYLAQQVIASQPDGIKKTIISNMFKKTRAVKNDPEAAERLMQSWQQIADVFKDNTDDDADDEDDITVKSLYDSHDIRELLLQPCQEWMNRNSCPAKLTRFLLRETAGMVGAAPLDTIRDILDDNKTNFRALIFYIMKMCRILGLNPVSDKDGLLSCLRFMQCGDKKFQFERLGKEDPDSAIYFNERFEALMEMLATETKTDDDTVLELLMEMQKKTPRMYLTFYRVEEDSRLKYIEAYMSTAKRGKKKFHGWGWKPLLKLEESSAVQVKKKLASHIEKLEILVGQRTVGSRVKAIFRVEDSDTLSALKQKMEREKIPMKQVKKKMMYLGSLDDDEEVYFYAHPGHDDEAAGSSSTPPKKTTTKKRKR